MSICSATGAVQAQQRVDFVAPPPAKGYTVPPLPAGPLYYQTGEGNEIKVVVVARGLSFPYSIAFLPDGTILFSEKNAGRLRIIRDGVLDPRPAGGIPKVVANNFSGLLDIELHPDFRNNQLIYFGYNKALEGGNTAVAVGRGKWDGRDLREVQDVYVATPGTIAGSRIAFGADRHLYITIFGAFGNVPQQGNVLDGKVLRVTEEGRIPADNPFVGMEGFKPEIYSIGHRSASGIVLHQQTGMLWEAEMGPNGGDEVNILKPGANYGWPLVSTGRNYAGPYQTMQFNNVKGMEDPVIYWMPNISVSGIAFYYGEKFPAWKNSLFVGGLRTGEIPGTGRLERIQLNADLQEIRRETLLADLRHRVREVAVSPDGYVYVLTDDADGAVLRIEPSDRTALPARPAESDADVSRGQAIFEQRCMICHGVTRMPSGPVVGPHMAGIVGRKAAGLQDFTQYSPALKKSGLTWDLKTLDEFLKMPMTKVPGTTMPMMIGDAKERADVIGYLATLK